MDKIEKFDEALIHHGSFSKRLYILKYPENAKSELVKNLLHFATQQQYTKVVGKIPKNKLSLFLRNGFKMEASIPKFYNGIITCCFVSKFTDMERAVFNPTSLNAFKKVLVNYEVTDQYEHNNILAIRSLGPADVEKMVEVFIQVFKTYPFPILNKEYLLHTMENDVCYFGVFIDDELCSISSAEMDVEHQNAEMTDFAVLETARGKGLSKILLQYMENEMKNKDMKTLYTIARLESIPMNKTFLGAGYSYAGTLINNTNISGGIESMNVLYKFI